MPIAEHPVLHIGEHGYLGPDPEPLGERFDELMRRESTQHPRRVRPRPHAVRDARTGREDPSARAA